MPRATRTKTTPTTATAIDSTRHTDTRANIPTEETRAFMPDDTTPPKLYKRDPSLDPQLVWQGKDEQDAADLAVPVVPIYIQEKIHPQALIEDLRAQSQQSRDTQLDLFADFNGLNDFDKQIDFYHHAQHWTNRLILGDSLLAMTSLAEKEKLAGQVQCIYIDPPYGIKFNSNWQVSTRKRDVKDGKVEDATRQPEQIKAYRDTWELGIHSYLAYLRDRLVAARELLADSGSIFVQIGDENVHLIRNLMDEVFGSDNFCSLITYSKTSGAGSFAVGTNILASVSDYLLWYAKDIANVKYQQLYLEREVGGAGGGKYTTVEVDDGKRRPIASNELQSGIVAGRLLRYDNLTSQTTRTGQTTVFEVRLSERAFWPSRGGWKTNKGGMERLLAAGRVAATGDSLSYVRYFDDFSAFSLTNNWLDIGGVQSRADPKVYVVQTSSTAVQRCILMTTDPGDLVLDPTCGSGTTAYVAEQWGRRWITIDTSRVALALARTRLMGGRFPYYLLADSLEGIGKEAQLTGIVPPDRRPTDDIKHGFVYRRVPHVTLKSIANNPEIIEGMTRAEIDAAISRHADTEILYDQPYEDRSRVRVTGPFTVESLSPHRQITVEQKIQHADEGIEGASVRILGGGKFALTILDYLKQAGVQNTIKQERLNFDRLEPFAGEYLHAEGDYTENDRSRRVAVCIGPEYGTVSPELIREAAKEAIRGIGFDLLVVCGFAFDPHVSEEAKPYGRLTVLPAKMNPDLSMGDNLLKKTGAANLFMVFGEPDIAIHHEDGQLTVAIQGLDVYDPTTGNIRSNSTDDIACWFIDTAYNGESFFVRHAYFTGANDPYDKLKRTLRNDIDEAAWASLYRTTSRPFAPPTTGKIAIKVINHYGDEVMKVYNVR